ncbi:tetratricopeptide repeat protein, partial [Myxococcota bacterium]|nr:tetratricopeptide repeat protein [Myxococcota bacterium]
MTVSVLSLLRRVWLVWFLAGTAVVLFAPPVVSEVQAKKKKRRKKKRRGKKSDPKRKITKEKELKKKAEYELDESLQKTKDLKPVGEEDKGPTLTLEQLQQRASESLMEEKLEEEIQLARELLKYETECKDSSPVRYRLADLYWEKSKRAFFKANDFSASERERKEYSVLMDKLQKRTVKHYKKIVRDCGDYEELGKVLFYLGKALVELDRSKSGVKYFKRIIDDFPESKWVSNAWYMVGEYYFNIVKDARKALAAYKKVEEYEATPVLGFAIYKQGWCHINNADWDLALDTFSRVIRISDDKKLGLDNKGRLSLRKEGLKDYVRAYANIGVPANAYKAFRKIGGKTDVRWMMERLGDWFVRQGAHADVVTLFHDIIAKYHTSTRLPIWQGRIVDASSNLGNRGKTVQYTKTLTKYFLDIRDRRDKGELNEEEKEQADKDLKEAEEIAENTLRRLALEYHKDAKKLRGKARDRSYKNAHDLYRHYLTVFPDPDPNADVNYVFYMRFYFAEVLFKLENFKEAADNYEMVVDMDPYPEDKKRREIVLAAAEESVRSYDELVEDLDRKSPPVIGGTDKKEIPEVKEKLINACLRYIKYVGSKGDQIVEIRYKMARIYYTYNHYDKAAPAFEDIVSNHPSHEVACYSANLSLDIHNG